MILESWAALDLDEAPPSGPVAFCGDLGPESLLAAYRAGVYPFPARDPLLRDLNEAQFEEDVADGRIAVVGDEATDPYSVAWWSPDPRPLIPVTDAHLGHSLAKQLRNRAAWWTSLNREFTRVVDACRAERQPEWITDQLADSLARLHESGWALSAEVWEGDELIGGVFGIRTGAVLSLDSMFHRRSNAAKVAIADLAARFARVGGLLLDAQWDSPPARGIGAVPVPRARFLELLRAAPELPLPPDRPLPARRLASAD